MAADTFQVKRGTTAAVNAYLPAVGEPVYDITLKQLHMGDGVTLGGTATAPKAYVDALRSDIANSADIAKGAKLVGFRSRTVADHLLDELNARDFGAVGGVGVDETARLQAGINATPSGGTFFIPAGVWEYTHLVVNKPMVIRGAGPTTSLYSTAPTGNGIEFVGASRLYRVGVKDLSISSTVNSTSGAALRFSSAGHGFIDNVWVAGSSPTARPFDGVVLSDVAQFGINNLQINDCRGTGLSAIAHCIDIYVVDSRSDANVTDGILIRDSEGMYFANVTAYFNDGAGWSLPYGGLFDNKNMWFVNCVGDSSGSGNWIITDLHNAKFTNCWGCTQKSTALTFVSGLMLLKHASGKLSRIDLIGLTANNNNSHGVSIDGGEYITIVSGVTEANGVAALGSGVNVVNSTDVKISALRSLSNSDKGVTVGASVVDFDLLDSSLRFNVTGQFVSSSANPVLRNIKGYVTANNGSSTIPSGSTSVVVAHGLAITPLPGKINITPTALPTSDTGNFYITSIGATNFTVNVRTDPGASGFPFNWAVTD